MELKGVEKLLKTLDKITGNKHNFIKGKDGDYGKLLSAVKELTELNIAGRKSEGLLSLVVENLDQEQIFQQIDINNDADIPDFVVKCGKILTKPLAVVEEEEEAPAVEEDEENEQQVPEDDDEGDNAEDGDELSEEENEEEAEKEEIPVEDEEDELEEDDGEKPNGSKSTFEEVTDKLSKKISQLEEEALKGRSWQMKGEVTGSKREKNALLEEVLEFDLGARPKPQITEKTTKTLEDIIIQRISSKCYDNVIRKVRTDDNKKYSKELVLDHTKSSVPLSELYEKSYLKQVSGDQGEEDKQAPEKKEITKMLNSLFGKLDALSNFYHTLNRDGKELKIISNDPVAAEDCLVPESANDAQLMAPPEETAHSKKKKHRKFPKKIEPAGKFKKLKEEKVKKRKITDLVPLEDALKASKKKKLK
ncbi:hypothetical protein DMENIID0001_166730 [Sergentomyia squamirostris]